MEIELKKEELLLVKNIITRLIDGRNISLYDDATELLIDIESKINEAL